MELYLSRIMLNPRSKAVMHDLGGPRELHKTISRCFPKIDGQEDKPQHEKATPRNTFNVLHRLDRKRDSIVLYVQSRVEPDWNQLPPDYGQASIKPVHDLYANIANGDRLRFRLAANPTKRVPNSDEKSDEKYKTTLPPGQHKKLHGKHESRRRIEILGDREPDENGVRKTREEKLIDWLNRKGERVEQLIEAPGNSNRGEKIAMGGFRILSIDALDEVANVTAAFGGKIRFKKARSDKRNVTLDAVVFDGVLEVTEADAFRNSLANGIGTGKAYGYGLMSVAPARQ